ncbi:MAG: glycosyl transferase [Gammaproteobacteria bacterium]|nr:MAG: glycosyl transferase [Gammaproteobacteria bacterium]
MMLLFAASVLFCLHTYAGFPLWLHWRASKRPPLPAAVPPAKGNDWPSVSVIIAAHNEARHLPAKIRSLDALDYPADRLEVVFVSDGSSDATNRLLGDAVAERAGWRLIEQAPAAGKPSALNRGVAAAAGEVLLMMDARQPISTNAAKALVARLLTPGVGAVSGELVLATDAGGEAGNVGLYWRYERWIRANESRLFSTTGATGALYAIRHEDFQPLPPDTLLDDFDIPVRLLRQGRRTLFEPEAKVFDQAEASAAGEFRRKVRTLAGNYQSFRRHPWLFNPATNPVWWQFLSHKVFRLLVPFAMGLALVSSLLGDGILLDTAFWLQIAFYALGLWGLDGSGGRLANVIAVFLQLNAAAVLGAWRALTGTAGVRWKRVS